MKIAVIGNYGATNIGDDAILTALLKELAGHKVTVFSAYPEMTKPLFGTQAAPLFPLGIRSIYRNGFRESFHALKKSDVVILGGGGLFQDSYLFACFLWAWQILWVKLLSKPLFICATGIGPLKTRIGRFLTRWAYHQANVVTVRDQYSAEILRKIGFKGEIHVTADPVFLFKKPNFTQNRSKGTYIISLRPWLKYKPKILSVFTAFLQELKESKHAEFIFVSMQQIKEHDMQMIEPLVSKLGGELYLPNHFADLLQIMETAEFAIGMRYHFMIAAILTQTPLLPVSYAPKTEEIFEESELRTYVSQVSELSGEKLKEDLKRLSLGYNNAMVYENTLLKRYRERAEKGAQLLRNFLKRFDEPKKE
ncbi:polysaccharide pyruvyl transferase family protein [Candidatus Peregrinibacteria bacterium]|nr:polysaccharide pyruvyl transferase family protein [Candidatus Peregrinibacteria bacterium]